MRSRSKSLVFNTKALLDCVPITKLLANAPPTALPPVPKYPVAEPDAPCENNKTLYSLVEVELL